MSRSTQAGTKTTPVAPKDRNVILERNKVPEIQYEGGIETVAGQNAANKRLATIRSHKKYGFFKGVALAPEPLETTQLLGGLTVFGLIPRSSTETHDLLMRGLPNKSVDRLLGNLKLIKDTDALELGLGVSVRTHQRAKAAPEKLLSPTISGKAWTFASILAQATSVFGSQEIAEDWLQQPSLALDSRSPISLLSTPEGVDMVKTVLTRIDYGVYT